ncbi:hypothetical protein [Shewanella sp. AC91-MNA-CIBAN-0169]|uniref:hypothetical protein n=1 Tax=Shewanella sp. AC91-MNA-CIBAN-0169 TaxID=3140466 RepID=UPI003332F96D
MKLYSRLTGEFEQVNDGVAIPSGLYALIDNNQQTILFDDGSGKHQTKTDVIQFYKDERGQSDSEKCSDNEALAIIFDAIKHIEEKFKDNSRCGFSHLLPPEISEFISPSELEQAIAKGFSDGVFQMINQRPRMSMRYDVELMATSRVKRYASNYQAHLVAHSECWQQRTFTGIIPKKLKGQISEDEIVIYENMVYARLIDNLLRYLAGVQARISQILKVIEEFGQLDAQDNVHHYVTQIAKDWGRAFDQADADDLAKQSNDQMDSVQTIRGKLIQMRNGSLYRAIPQNLQVGIALKSTNILIHDDNYSRLASLWNTWSKISVNKRLNPNQLLDVKQHQQLIYTDYIERILQQIFNDIGWSINSEMTCLTISDGINISITNPIQGNWEFCHLSHTIFRVVVNAEPLIMTNLNNEHNVTIIVPQVIKANTSEMVIELSPLNLHAKEALARIIVKSIWRWLLEGFNKPLPNKLPTIVEQVLSHNRSIYAPLNTEQTNVVINQTDQKLVNLIKLKNAIAKFVRLCPYCGNEVNKYSFTSKSNTYFKGECKDKSCHSIWTLDRNKSPFFVLNNTNDNDGRYAFSIT